MSGDYVIAEADASRILEFPGGIALLTIRAGCRFSASEAVVKQHLELFVPIKPAASAKAAA